jgi:NAD/NADP transhydrogenase beta subunit
MACNALVINNGLVSHHPRERLPTMPHLVVLLCSLILLAMVGVALLIYYQHTSPEVVSHQNEPQKQSYN